MLISKFGGSSEKAISQLPKNIPSDYKAFLLKYNGGQTPETSFKANNISSDIVGFYGVGEVKYSFNDRSIREFENQSFLPIAFDSYGNDIALSLSDGSIAFFDHEITTPTIIAKSFCDFIALVQSKPIDPKHLKPVEQREQEMLQRGKGDRITDALRELWRNEIKKYSAISQEEVCI